MADRRITHPDGGILAITYLGRPWRRAVATAVVYVGLIIASISAATGHWVTTVVSVIALLTAIVLVVPRAIRRFRDSRLHDARAERPWLMSDVASEPHRGIGDRLMNDATQLADHASARLVLAANPDNAVAMQLYLRHGFTAHRHYRGRTLMQRFPGPIRGFLPAR